MKKNVLIMLKVVPVKVELTSIKCTQEKHLLVHKNMQIIKLEAAACVLSVCPSF